MLIIDYSNKLIEIKERLVIKQTKNYQSLEGAKKAVDIPLKSGHHKSSKSRLFGEI